VAFNIVCAIFGLLSASVLLIGAVDNSYYYLGGALIGAVLLSTVLVNYLLKNFVLPITEQTNLHIDNTMLKFKVKSLELQIKLSKGEQQKLEGKLLQAIGEQQGINALLTKEKGSKLTLEGELAQANANYEVASGESSRLLEDNTKIKQEMEGKIGEFLYAQIRSKKLEEVDNQIAGIHLFLYKKIDIAGLVRNTLKNFIIKPIREQLNTYLTQKGLDEFVSTVSIFMVSQKETNIFGFEVLAASDLDTGHIERIEREFRWDLSEPGEYTGTKGIASRCLKSKAPFIFIPDLSDLDDMNDDIWVKVVDGETKGMLLCLEITMKYGDTIERLGVINVTAPTKGTGTKIATTEEINKLPTDIANLVLNYMPNLCSLIYLYKYAKNLHP
jgi:hypothetical protein